MSIQTPKSISTLATAWVLAFWIFSVGVPLFALFTRLHGVSLWDAEVLSISGYTVVQAGLSAAISAVIGLPLGLWIGRSRKSAVSELFLGLPFAVPTVVAAITWVMILGRNGWLARTGLALDWAYSLRAVVLAHVFFNAPWIALLVTQARRGVSESQLEASRLLGASRWHQFRFVEWPWVRWSFLSAVTQAFSFCSMSFALVLILGGGPPVQTLETALYSRLRFGTLDLEGAIACAIWELLITLLPWAAVLFFQIRDDRNHFTGRSFRTNSSAGRGGILAAIFFLPYLVTLIGNPWGKIAWAAEVIPATKISAEIAFSTAAVATLSAVAGTVALSRIRTRKTRALATWLLSLPGGVSVLVLGLGFWLAYGRYVDPFEGSLFAMVALQSALFFNIAFRIIWPVAQYSRKNLLEAAATLGASPARAFFTVEWPRWKPALSAAFALVAAMSIGEVAAVSLFYSEKLIPLPLLIARWSAQYRFEEARAIAGLLLILSAGILAAVFFARRDFSETYVHAHE